MREHQLRIVRPLLPGMLTEFCVEGLQVGKATVDLQYQRSTNGKVVVQVVRQDGDLDVDIE